MNKMKTIYEKVKIHINKHIIAYAILIFILGFMGYALGMNLNIDDELWNFSSSYKMTQGIALYAERNVIVTPLFFYIAQILLSVLGANLFIFRIYNILIFIALLVIMLKLLKTCGLKRNLLIWCITPIFFFFANIIGGIGANYNVLVMVFFLIGVHNLIATRDKKINVIFQGFIIFLIFFTKQNVAVFYAIGLIGYSIGNRGTLKEKITILIKVGIIASIPLILYGVYLYRNGNLYSFINYCFLGITEFSVKNLGITDNVVAKVILGMFIITEVTAIYYYMSNKDMAISKRKILKILIIFSLANIAITYPIFNLAHIVFGTFMNWILMEYLIYTILSPLSRNEKIVKIKKVGKLCTICLIIVTLCISIKGTIDYFRELTSFTYPMQYQDPFYGALLTPGTFEKIEVIDEYILKKNGEGKKVIIFSLEADMYLVPLKQNNLDFELASLGNWGYQGEERVLNKIKQLQNTYILVTQEKVYDQESLKIRNYIKENYQKIEQIEHFDVYAIT